MGGVSMGNSWRLWLWGAWFRCAIRAGKSAKRFDAPLRSTLPLHHHTPALTTAHAIGRSYPWFASDVCLGVLLGAVGAWFGVVGYCIRRHGRPLCACARIRGQVCRTTAWQ